MVHWLGLHSGAPTSGFSFETRDLGGRPSREHQPDHARERVDVVRQIWETEEAFDYKGDYFDLHGVRGNPKPFGGSSPLVVSAG